MGYGLKIGFDRNASRISQILESKGKFVLATNKLNCVELNAEEIIKAYRDRNRGVESGFKFLKNKTFRLNQIFLKKESRIEAMMIIMAFILFTSKLSQLKIRDGLEAMGKGIESQTGKQTRKPSFSWVAYLMRHVTKVRIGSGSYVLYMRTSVFK